MTEDRLFSAIKAIVRRILNDSNEIDFKAMYLAKVVAWNSSGINPSGTVDVNFVDERLNSAVAVPVLPPIPGTSYKPQQGTQCLVGWYGGDETSPYATGWPGEGGSLETVVAATTKVDVTAATVNLGDTGGATLCKSALGVALQAFASACTASTDPTVMTAATALNGALTGIPLAPPATPLLSSIVTAKTKAS